ncbi:MAG TPA: hypothetical protein VNI36_13835 [Candidatus Dormibacteraeota bacterium]|nr:hypothetical protein [Candidatus Dormibacteraeota bacterium]
MSIYAAAFVFAAVLASPHVVSAQKKSDPNLLPGAAPANGAAPSGRVSLAPRFSPGQVFRYAMEFQTTTATSKSGLATDPQGPSTLVVTWDATIRVEVLPGNPTAPGDIRLRTTYEKSTASIHADTFDPAAEATRKRYQKLQGKVVEFTLDAAGNVKAVSGLEGIVNGEKGLQEAREWIAQLDASSGAPPGGVTVGQAWSSEQPAASLPLAGMVWRTDTKYLRNEPCYPANPGLPRGAFPAEGAAKAGAKSPETCAVLLTHLNLIPPKQPLRDQSPEAYRKNGVHTAGVWGGSAQSLKYISLATGAVVSVSQTGTEQMDVTFTTTQNTSMHYAGTIDSRSQVELVADAAKKQ